MRRRGRERAAKRCACGGGAAAALPPLTTRPMSTPARFMDAAQKLPHSSVPRAPSRRVPMPNPASVRMVLLAEPPAFDRYSPACDSSALSSSSGTRRLPPVSPPASAARAAGSTRQTWSMMDTGCTETTSSAAAAPSATGANSARLMAGVRRKRPPCRGEKGKGAMRSGASHRGRARLVRDRWAADHKSKFRAQLPAPGSHRDGGSVVNSQLQMRMTKRTLCA